MSRNWWTRVDPRVAPAGDVGGDGQLSEAYGARFWHPLADGRFAVIDRAFYVADHGGGPVLECQTEYLICRDWQRPGDTEERSDARYEEHRDHPATEAAAKRAAERNEEWTCTYEWGRIYPQEVLA
jgi:hypothetical protein